jgi:leucyl-tRNA synthetase
MAPHIAEELWQATGFQDAKMSPGPTPDKQFVHISDWPKYDDALTIDNQIELVLQVNGKIVSKVAAPRGLARDQAEKIALDDAKIRIKIDGQTVRKVIVVPDKLVNVVI